MKAPQLFCGALALAMSVSACQKRTSQAEVTQTANDAASRIQTESVKVGEKVGDVWLATKIHSKFVGDRDIKARDVTVMARDGVVTLKGRVPNESAHQLALTLVKNTDGVKQIVDNLDVEIAGPPPAGAVNNSTPGAIPTTGTTVATTSPAAAAPVAGATSDDLRITTSIRSKYFIDDRIKGRHIDVTTNSGVVTLKGEVADDIERAEALLLARTTEGVNRVEDNLTISPGSSATSPPAAAPSAATAPPVPTAPPGAAAPPPTTPPTAPAATPNVAGPPADAALTERVKSQLSSDTQIKNAPIEVTAKSGVVLLEGSVPSSAVKQRTLTVVRGIDGVTQVVDRIQVSATNNSKSTSTQTKASATKGSTARKAKR